MKAATLTALAIALAANLLAVAMNPSWQLFALTSAALIAGIVQIARR